MLAGLLMAAAIGQVVTVVAPAGAQPGDKLIVRRLEPAVGAPGRAPFFRWADVGRVRVESVRAGGSADVTLLRGRVAAGDRVTAD